MRDDEGVGKDGAGNDAVPEGGGMAGGPAQGGRAASVARGAGRSLASGYAAVRDVRKASRRHTSARTQAKALRKELGANEATLEHRSEVEGSYDRIVAEQTQALEAAQQDAVVARERIGELEGDLATLKAQLATLRESNEDKLRPYRNLLDTTKGRSDAAAVALAEARRAVKAADARMAEAVRARDQRVQSASRAVDGAQGRLHKAESELRRLQDDPKASPAAMERIRGEVASERSAVASAKADVARASDEAQLAVDTAQTHLWTQRQSLEVAERQAESARHDATEGRGEYDALYKQAKAEEGELEAAIKERGRALEAARGTQRQAEERAQVARAALDEAADIRATPELTAELRHRVVAGRSELERQEQEVSELAKRERRLRRRTRTVRLTFFAAVVALLAVVAAIVWLATRG